MSQRTARLGGRRLAAPHGRTSIVVAIGIACSVAAGCGASRPQAQRDKPDATGLAIKDYNGDQELALPAIPGVRQRVVGVGASASVILTSRRTTSDESPLIIFLHGWIASRPATYGAWLRHLTDRGSTVIFPIYQDATAAPRPALDNALQGVRAALRMLPNHPDTVVAVGHTTGGALAMDYAATASANGLPAPTGVLAVYPARNLGQGRVIAAADTRKIEPGTQVVALTGKADPVVGGVALARQMVRAPSQLPARLRRLITVADGRPDGPVRSDASARQAFWVPLDQMIDRAATR